MEAVKFIYQEHEVDFLLNGNVKVNATQMAKIFGKQVNHFLDTDSTKNFIDVCLYSRDHGNINVNCKEDLVQVKQKSGTWMHRILALKFAAWLDPKFELWVFSTIDKIILGHFREIKEATIEKLEAEKAREEKRKVLLEQYPEFNEFLELEQKVSAADKKRAKAIKESTNQLKLDFLKES